MIRKHRAARRNCLHFECLESRRVMAGNVTVELIDGALFIDGDDESNGIAIVGTENPGEVRVIGTPAAAGDFTELNNQTDPLTFVVTSDIVIWMGSGNDGVELNNVAVPRHLTIETGDGFDRVAIGSSVSAAGVRTAPAIAWPPAGVHVPGGMVYAAGVDPGQIQELDPIHVPLNRTRGEVEVGRDLSIKTGDGSDYVYLGCTQVTGEIAVQTEDGYDLFIARTVKARTLDADLGRDTDLANIAALRTRGQMTLDTGFGDDFVSFANSHVRGMAVFKGSHGNNQFYISTSVFSGTLYGQFGNDNDRLVIKSSMLLGNSSFVTGGGGDRIDIDYCFGRFVSADTGAGGDSINIRGSALDNIYAAMGDGDDRLALIVSRILHPFMSNGGGGGNDVMHEYGSVGFYTALPGFEHTTHGWPSWLEM